MVQLDWLYERLNPLLDMLVSGGPAKANQEKRCPGNLPMQEYLSNEGNWLVLKLVAETATLNPITSKKHVCKLDYHRKYF
jgi:hypothetical protein